MALIHSALAGSDLFDITAGLAVGGTEVFGHGLQALVPREPDPGEPATSLRTVVDILDQALAANRSLRARDRINDTLVIVRPDGSGARREEGGDART